MFIKVFIITIIIIGLALLGLGIQTFFSKKKKFPETRVGHNKEMRKRKIYCIKTEQKRIDNGLDCDKC